tara:strand:- start:1090 stop:1542 length:453 start_codon:yes stop_codon:yes gene_type:complete
MTKAIICDLDGTLSINDHGRSFFKADDCHKDSLNEPVALVLKLAVMDNIEIIYLSGREDIYNMPTQVFLKKHKLLWRSQLSGDDLDSGKYPLFMRNTGDNRADDIIKWEIYQKHIEPNYDIQFILDDRQQVVDMWRSKGLTCFQVADGKF